MNIQNVLQLCKETKANRVAIATYQSDYPASIVRLIEEDPALEFVGVIRVVTQPEKGELKVSEAAALEFDAIVVVDNPGTVIRNLESLINQETLVLLENIDLCVFHQERNTFAQYQVEDEARFKANPVYHYLKCGGLNQSFAEFGTFWGNGFFCSWFDFKDQLKGKFFAFDSFAGLSEPLHEESALSNGDFKQGAYLFNQKSFDANCRLMGMGEHRYASVAGFFDETLRNESGEPVAGNKYGIEAETLSVVRIDCDLYEPTLDVLNFILPLMEPGGLIYFDDWRLCRASPIVGERAAAIHWLKENPEVELIDFPTSHWQNQWFIFQRKTQ